MKLGELKYQEDSNNQLVEPETEKQHRGSSKEL